MSRKHKNGSTLILVSAITGCISSSAFASYLVISIGITSYAIGLKNCVTTAGIKTYKSIIKKKKNDRIILLAKSKLNSMEVLISETLIDSNIIHYEFALVNNVLKNMTIRKKK